ncbi:MAG: homospermidine biosynthesis protein [Bacteroidota bacterium]
MGKSRFLKGQEIAAHPIPPDVPVTELVDNFFQAYNAARLREAAQLFVRKMLENDVTVGISLSGALTPAGLGGSCIVPLIENGFVDWIVSTGANLYHDTHFAIGYSLHRGTPFIDDRLLRKEKVVRIYDILFDYDVLLSTDSFYREIVRAPEFQREMSTAEFHHLVGKYISERERILGIRSKSILSAAYKYSVPVYTSAPGDSSIGMNIAETVLVGNKLRLNVAADVNETAAIVLYAKRNAGSVRRSKGKSAVFIVGGGSPKNFMLQTEPQIQEVLGIKESGHDYFLQITDARPDTGGLSGATPSEAVSWGKVDPEKLPDAVVVYADSTIALPILTSYALAKHPPRTPKRLFERREEMLVYLEKEFRKTD